MSDYSVKCVIYKIKHTLPQRDQARVQQATQHAKPATNKNKACHEKRNSKASDLLPLATRQIGFRKTHCFHALEACNHTENSTQQRNCQRTNRQPTPDKQPTNTSPFAVSGNKRRARQQKTTTKTYTKKKSFTAERQPATTTSSTCFFYVLFFFISLPSALFCGPEASHLRLTPRRHHFQTTPVVARGSPPNGGSAAAAPCEAPPPAGAPSSAPGGTELFQLAGAWALLLPWVWAWASRALGQPCSAGTAPRTSACGSLGSPAPPLQQPSASTRRRRSPRTGCSRRPLPAGCSATARTP